MIFLEIFAIIYIVKVRNDVKLLVYLIDTSLNYLLAKIGTASFLERCRLQTHLDKGRVDPYRKTREYRKLR